ncbi:hypothetical protein JPSP36_23590 [Staphylococcus pseudintermedius]
MKISNQKIYEQIADILIQQIEEGVLKEGDRLPSIQKLAAEYGVSNASIREALNALRIIGLILNMDMALSLSKNSRYFLTLPRKHLHKKGCVKS